jgi:hypothetical protein
MPILNIRYASEDDAAALERLARMDSRRPPRGLVIVAEVGGQLWAALSLDDYHAVADPRRPAGDLIWTLSQRGRQLKRALRGGMQLLPRVWPAQQTQGLEAA